MIRRPLRALWLEIRRNEYRWLFLVVAIGVSLAMSDRIDNTVMFWTDATLAWRDALFVLAPWTAAAAAWTAGRERRHGLDDLLSTTAKSPFRRRLRAFAGVLALGLAAYGVIGLWVFALAAGKIAWAQPEWDTIFTGAAGLTAFATLGFAWGTWKPRRATAFAVMIVFALAILLVASQHRWFAHLSPVPAVDRSPWLGLSPDLSGLQTWLFLGVTGLGLTALARISSRGWLIRGALAGSAIVTLLAVSGLIREDQSIRAIAAQASDGERGIPIDGSYVPICSSGIVPVCVHPAFEPLLDRARQGYARLFAAAPNSPVRVDLVPVPAGQPEAGVWAYKLGSANVAADLAKAAHAAAISAFAPATGGDAPLTNAAIFAAMHLTGVDIACEGTAANSAGIAWAEVDCDAFERLVALPDDALSSWFAGHAASIHDGTISREDLP